MKSAEPPGHPAGNPRLLAFYLPQFHPIPENDRWWGKGFTEWTNVARARPIFPGHYQPHLPADLGFYDLRLPEAREAQASLAREHGIGAFCYYHYWFGGKRVLERPFNEVLASGRPDFPFCLCWANENWTRTWDGCERDVLLAQNYGPDDDVAHIRTLLPAFADPRYLRINARPLFLVYRVEDLPDPAATARRWREAAKAEGIGDLYLVTVENPRGGGMTKPVMPAEIGFDAAVQFAPNVRAVSPPARFTPRWFWHRVRRRVTSHHFDNYAALVTHMAGQPAAGYKRFHCITPGWDNSSRRRRGATIFLGATPTRYEAWLDTMWQRTVEEFSGDERLLFVNAWNEWAEGNHLEPCQRWDRAYLEATRRAVTKPSDAESVC